MLKQIFYKLADNAADENFVWRNGVTFKETIGEVNIYKALCC